MKLKGQLVVFRLVSRADRGSRHGMLLSCGGDSSGLQRLKAAELYRRRVHFDSDIKPESLVRLRTEAARALAAALF